MKYSHLRSSNTPSCSCIRSFANFNRSLYFALASRNLTSCCWVCCFRAVLVAFGAADVDAAAGCGAAAPPDEEAVEWVLLSIGSGIIENEE